MKKTATKISGILTLIFSIVLLAFSALILSLKFEVSFVSNLISNSSILSAGTTFITSIYVSIPTLLIKMFMAGVSANILTLAFVSMLFAFSILMVFWGIKEIVISHRDDVDFANCKKTCGFMFFIKFVFFLYSAFVLVLPFLFNSIKTEVESLNSLLLLDLNIQNGFFIFIGIIVAIALLLFLLPVLNVSIVAKKVKQDSLNNKMAGQELTNENNAVGGGQDVQELEQFYKSTPQPTMQANMPPLPGFNSSISTYQTSNEQNVANVNPNENVVVKQSQPVQNSQIDYSAVQQNISQTTVPSQIQTQNNVSVSPTINSQPATNVQTSVNVQPNQQNAINNSQISNGNIAAQNISVATNSNAQPVGENSSQITSAQPVLSEKAQADIDRLERLKNMGAITPENYEAMKKKILEENN